MPARHRAASWWETLTRGRDSDLWYVLPGLGLALLFTLRMMRKMPVVPVQTGDSAAYLAMAEFRPPLYGWLVNSWVMATGGIANIAVPQLILLGCAVAVFAIELGRLLRTPLLSALAVPAILLHTAIYDSSGWLLTESPYAALTLLGLAMQFRYARRGDLAPLLLAAAIFGLSTLLRSTGAAFLPLPLLAVLFDRRFRLPAAFGRTAMAALVAGGVVASGMGWTWLKNGHFELGSWAGISLLGKSLVLLEPEDAATLPPAVSASLQAAADARRLIAEQPDIAARMRAQIQSSGDVRFPGFWRAAKRDWPEWQQASDREKDLLARAIDKQLIAAHPHGYLELWARDWLALIIMPSYWPAWATTVPEDWSVFAFCRELDSCWGLERYDLPFHARLLLIGASVFGAILAVALIPLLAWRVLTRRADPATVLVWGVAMLLHGSLIITSAVEAGHVRYTVALHILDITMLSWLLLRLLPGLGRPAAVEARA
ncbi:hypothetical protein JMJ55_06740 [Belnapia sp. T6]|uniref:Glycosyltransferase RgtA/B/C/D-like domain-containing protein n=1 Tax=Belnapia mucosa TaxID=2804532 RepID=A0ABS1V2U2_9PROT|nr:hypothetical protein [Belnapia mucosa]MBL6455014.1 hypothetical protein [Belnapia mucosa]